MKNMLISFVFGILFAVAGLVFEFLEIPGLCYGDGYVHLRFFGTLFYAFHSEDAVLTVVFLSNFFIGACLGWGGVLIFRKSNNPNAL